jgi:uncharacterized protein (DUF58 family)
MKLLPLPTMRFSQRLTHWLETRWVTPSFGGWMLLGLALFYFVAGTNTLAGWLYVISGISIALLAIAAVLPERTLRDLRVRRAATHPVSAGEPLTIELTLENPTPTPKALLQVQDQIPAQLWSQRVARSDDMALRFAKSCPTKSIEQLAAGETFHWSYSLPTRQRGIYHWHDVTLRTGAPLGLFWCRRVRPCKAMAIVYPPVLPLSRCPLIDDMGRDFNLLTASDRRAQAATEGITRSLRPYRWGDPTRFIHWRTSARYGELRVRELEVFTGGQDLILCLDSARPWHSIDPASSSPDAMGVPPEANVLPFEQAVIAVASLYFYACHRQMSVKLWTAGTGLLHSHATIVQALAGVMDGEAVRADDLPQAPLLWITQNRDSLDTLPTGSRWILWNNSLNPEVNSSSDRRLASTPGLMIAPTTPLQLQLQTYTP